MEREELCSYDLNQNGNGSLENDSEGEHNHIFMDHDNPLHEQMLLLNLPNQNGTISTDQEFSPSASSSIMETIIVMSDPLPPADGQVCVNAPKPQIIFVRDGPTDGLERESVVGMNDIQIDHSQSGAVQILDVANEIAARFGIKSVDFDVDEIKPLGLDGNICVKIDLNTSSPQTSDSKAAKQRNAKARPSKSVCAIISDIRHSLRPRRQVPAVETKPKLIQPEPESNTETDDDEDESDHDDEEHPPKQRSKAQTSAVESDDEFEEGDTGSEDELRTVVMRKCVVCLRHREFAEGIFDDNKQLLHHVQIMLAYVDVQVKRFSYNVGICPECFDQLQHWHIFFSAISKRHETVMCGGEKFNDEPVAYDAFQARVYRNFKKMGKVKEVYLSATHSHYARRHLSEKDWDFFCDHLFHSNSVKSEKSKELERFLTSPEKLSQMYCTKCNKLIPDGKAEYKNHMESVHSENPVLYPCDICGVSFPEKDMTASTEDYYPHWISHFYFNSCIDCGKRFPTKRALGQHRHAVHKNRQVKCNRCDKVLANKMSLDLHLLRHLPENEKNKFMTKCKLCKKRIAQWNMKSHMATHNDERPWKCDHCDATFKMKGALVSHRDVVHFNLKNHVCPTCGEAFKSASSLRGHVRRHEGRKDYKCEVCLKEYYTYSALKGHKVVHQTTRDFICEVCGKAFKKKKALDEHVTIHTGVKAHQCPICGREIRVKSNLYKHMKIHKKPPAESSIAPKPIKKRHNSRNATENSITGNNSTIANTSNTNTDKIIVCTSASSNSQQQSPRTVVVSMLTNAMPASTAITNVNIVNGSPRVSGVGSVLTNTVDVNSGHFTIQRMPQSATFVSSQFQTNHANAHTINMQHQHQDLLNVPLIPGHFYPAAGQSYFTAMD